METSVAFFIRSFNDSDDEGTTALYLQRRRLRDISNVLDMPNKKFIKLFRVSKWLFTDILKEIEPHFISRSNKDAIPPILKFAALLRFLAEGSYQQGVGQDFLIGMAQSTVSIVITETLNILQDNMCKKHIIFKLSEEEKSKSKEYFFNKFGFPGVVGCVDGTHINIIRPEKNEHHFFNRKGAHSLNVMITCDYNGKITSVDPRFGGASHDSVVWSMSNNRRMMENFRQDNSSWILGDAGYTLEPWLMIPYRNATEGSAESQFNTAHSKARSIVERVFGITKARWRCLLHARELHYQPEKVAKIVNVCCLLHNLCVQYDLPLDSRITVTDDEEDDNDEHQNAAEEETQNLQQEAKRIRDYVNTQFIVK